MLPPPHSNNHPNVFAPFVQNRFNVPMIAKRVIPCLDVHDGQVTRGVQFGRAEAGELRNVGDPVELALRYNEQGADEMVFFAITRRVSESVGVPVVASGGAGKLEHIAEVLTEGKADAVLAASIFHFGEYTVREVKEFLSTKGIPVRME